jgi:phage terminase large subunit-like protein
MTPIEIEALYRNWSFLARDDQIAPASLPGKNEPWQFWLLLAGRGFGKTRTGAEWVRERVKHGYRNIALIAPTTADVRKVMVEGPSGILNVCWDKDQTVDGAHMGKPNYSPSNRELTWANGAKATTFSAEEPDRLRGPQHDLIWADELAAWQYATEAWDMAMFGLRMGTNPQACVTTTPRPIPVLRELMKSPYTVLTRGSTYENRVNLAGVFLNTIIAKYQGTRLGRQELQGELLEEAEGALWTRAMIDKALLKGRLPDMLRIVVGVDPSVSANPTSNLCGIVVAGLGVDYRGYVLEDASGRFSPYEWARKTVDMLEKWKADRIVAEGNQGGDLVRVNIETVMKNAPISIVHASRSKQARGEPISALYEQGRVSHLQPFEELDDQMTTWEPLSGDPSPDRLDALVWALTELMLGVSEPAIVLPFVTGHARNIPGQGNPVPIVVPPTLAGA